MKYFIAIAVYLISCSAQAQSINAYNPYLQNTDQVLFVKTSSPEAIQGTMFLFERNNSYSSWKLKDSFLVVVGRAGLAKDPQSKIPFSNMPLKKEGDGKSPAGIFPLGKVFSYYQLHHMQMPSVQVDTNFYCVDDASSSYYNSLIVKDTAKETFNSFEYMKRNDDQYEYGVWVLYNSNPTVSGNGSCIFIHVWKDEQTGTSGCTALSKQNL